MTYTVTTTSGTTIATIADNTINRTGSSLTLIGKNYPGYGVFLNENFIRLLENFSDPTAPTNPLVGQLWYDNNNNILNLWDGSVWKPVSSAQSTSDEPPVRQIGDLWWDLNVSQLKGWDGEIWITIGPISDSNDTGVRTVFISDGTIDHPCVVITVRGNYIAIVNEDSEFIPFPSIEGFASIKRGVNLISTSNAKYAGVSEKSELLGNSTETSYIRNDQNAETIYTLVADKLGVNQNFQITSDTVKTKLINLATTANVEVWVGAAGSVRALSITSSGELKLDQLPLAINQGGTGSRVAVDARASLGLGTISIQNANLVAIIGGNITNVAFTNATINSLSSPLSIVDGGTGAANVASAKVNFGLNFVTNQSKTTMFTSPAFTGIPTANTATPGTNTTQLATTAFVKYAVDQVIDFPPVGVGYNQSWVTVTRLSGTTYTNSTAVPIMVNVMWGGGPGASGTLTVSGVLVARMYGTNSAGDADTHYSSGSAIVPAGASYIVSGNILGVAELR